jgi:hypothetical protein
LVKLQGRREGFAKFVENRDFARFAVITSNTGGTPSLDSAKILSRCHLKP